MTPARPMLSPEVIADFRRRTFTDALAELCVERGYRATTVADVVRRAKSSRNTVYEYFDNREQIFLAAQQRGTSEFLARARAADEEAAAEPLPRFEAALGAVLDWIAEEPALAWVCLVEAQCATQESFRRYHETISRLTATLESIVPSTDERVPTTEEALLGGIAHVLSQLIRSGDTARAPELLQPLAEFLCLPFGVAHDAPPGAEPSRLANR